MIFSKFNSALFKTADRTKTWRRLQKKQFAECPIFWLWFSSKKCRVIMRSQMKQSILNVYSEKIYPEVQILNLRIY